MPQAVSAFLLRTMRVDPKNSEALRLLGSKHAKDWGVIGGFLRDFRQRASVGYGQNSLDEVKRWLQCERWVLQGGDRPTVELDKLSRFLGCIHDGESHLEGEGFRSFLLGLATLDPQVVGEHLESLSVDEAWKEPLHWLLGSFENDFPDDLNGPWRRGFGIWGKCEDGSFAELRSDLKSLEQEPDTLFESQAWRLVILRLYRGRMSFLESRKWEITHHFIQHFSSNSSLRNAQRLLPTTPEQWSTDHRFFSQRGLEKNWLPLVMSRLMFLTRSKRQSEALQFLGFVLLQASLLKDGILRCGELPDFESAFLVKRLRQT